MSTEPAKPDVIVNTKTSPREQTRTRRVPPYNVVLENDDYHSFEFVVETLRKALGYTTERAYQLTLQAHTTGRSVVWTGPKEVAELKAEQIRTFHEIRDHDGAQLGPLHCCIEPAPGG
ncbi:MAG TPA: ATP-dependent Clp protease adaptor ClpS [Gemmataceae bacterium]|nr:ATP-dependent Clp protease adaptor ClpS [Gemmataceae bacterium]